MKKKYVGRKNHITGTSVNYHVYNLNNYLLKNVLERFLFVKVNTIQEITHYLLKMTKKFSIIELNSIQLIKLIPLMMIFSSVVFLHLSKYENHIRLFSIKLIDIIYSIMNLMLTVFVAD